MSNILDTGVSNVKNPSKYLFGTGAIKKLKNILDTKRNKISSKAIIFLSLIHI